LGNKDIAIHHAAWLEEFIEAGFPEEILSLPELFLRWRNQPRPHFTDQQ
jgi:hypothetical protein